MILRVLFLAAVVSTAAYSQVANEVEAFQPPPGELPTKPVSKCEGLRSLTGYDYTIVSASIVPAGLRGPEYCRVVGMVQPEVRFEVALPTYWHRRFLMVGNGGYAGEDLDQPARAAARDAATRGGFLFAQTNTGHDAQGQPLGAFALEPQKFYDYAFRAVHVTADTAKRIATAYYGVAPRRSYFLGCSTGGRQGLISAQRFPADFDGISAGAPVLNFVDTMGSYVNTLHAWSDAPVSEEKMKLAGAVVYGRCDALDGVKDGVIADPRRCDFVPSTHLPRCQGGADSADCFTDGQIRSLEVLYSEVKLDGRLVFPGWPVGAEALGANGRVGWSGWLTPGAPGAESRFAQFSQGFYRYMAGSEKEPNLAAARSVLNATDTDLSAFRDRGGKLLMWFGWADPALNPMMGVEYYEAVMKSMGPVTGGFFRLFMMPGVFHCAGGVGCDTAPRLATLIDWVERGRAPERIEASKVVDGKVLRTRPLCPYPQVAKYKGSGSTDDAANFTCAADLGAR